MKKCAVNYKEEISFGVVQPPTNSKLDLIVKTKRGNEVRHA